MPSRTRNDRIGLPDTEISVHSGRSMAKSMNKYDPSGRLTAAISIFLAVIGCLFYWSFPGFSDPLRLKWDDLIVARGPEPAVSDQVIVIDIDEQSLEAIGQWPWPRAQLAVLLDKISTMDALAITLDFLMPEPDRATPGHPATMSALESASPDATHKQLIQMPDQDAVLAAALSKGSFVLGYTFTFEANYRRRSDCRLHPVEINALQSPVAEPDLESLFRADGIICNLTQLSESAPYSGFLNGYPDSDGRIRRIPLLIRHGQAVYPSLALAALLASADSQSATMRKNRWGQRLLDVGPHTIPFDEKGNLNIRFTANRSELRHIPAAHIMAGKIHASEIRGRIALVGVSASGLARAYATPGNGSHTAVQVHGQALETILAGNYIWQSRESGAAVILLTIIAAAAIGFCVAKLELVPALGIGVATAAIVWSGTQLAFNTWQVLVSPLLPVGTIIVNCLLLMLYKNWYRQHNAQRSLEDALVLMRGSERRLDSIINTIPDIVFRLDASGRITFISPAVVRYNHQPEHLIGKHILELVSPDDRQKASYRINERRTGGRATADLEIRLNLMSSDDETPVQGQFFSISAVGIYNTRQASTRSFVGTQGIAKDISQRKHLEQQLKQAQKMEAMGNLAAGVAHDLNNILSGLVSYPELLLLDLPADSPIRDKIESIQQSGKRAAEVVQDLLMIARRGVKDHAPINVNQTIRDYLQALEFRQLTKDHPKLEIGTKLSEDLMNINGSAVHISKVVMNLVHNAAEAMPAGGNIHIGTTNRYLDTGLNGYERIPEGEYVVVQVADQGVGITSDILPHIFEPFYSKKRMGSSGSGLGMTVVWNTVKDHCGFIDIQSQEGEGTCFEVYLPAARDTELAVKNRIVLQDYTGDEKILVVDDIKEQRDIAVRMLGRLGYEVMSVSTGEAALAYLRENAVDLVVLDMVMPHGMDGLETYRRMLQIWPDQKAIIASGYATSDRVDQMLELGAGEYIRKPYSLEKIGLAVRNELDRK